MTIRVVASLPVAPLARPVPVTVQALRWVAPVVGAAAPRRAVVPRVVPSPLIALPAPRRVPVVPPALRWAPPPVPLRTAPPRARVVAPTAISPVPAQYVGITGANGTAVKMVPANLAVGPLTNITQFSVCLDAGSYP